MELSAGGFIIERADPPDRAARDLPRPAGGASAPQLPAPRPAQAPSAAPAGGCSRCNSLTFSQEWYDAFGLVLCHGCGRGEQLVSKSAAKQQFGLTDGDLKKLGSVRRANPQRKDWHPMQLFMRAQVAEASRQKHGGGEGGEAAEERQRARLEAKLQGRIQKREEEKTRGAREAEKMQRIRQRIEQGAAGPSGPPVQLSAAEVEQI